MAAGLSPLQQRILGLAYQGRRQKTRRDMHVAAADVVTQHYGVAHRDGRRYLSAQVAVHRSFRRLAERGLVDRVQNGHGVQSGIKLTPAGVATCEDYGLNG